MDLAFSSIKKQRAKYGEQIIKQASEALTAESGKGYSEGALRRFRQFFLEFRGLQIEKTIPTQLLERLSMIQPPLVAKSGIQGSPIQPPSVAKIATGSIPMPPQLSWMHYEKLMRVPDKDARMWYMQEAASQQWDYRTLKRNIDTQYYYRLMQTPAAHKPEVEQEMLGKTAVYQQEKSSFVKNPMLVEFLGLNQDTAFTESKLGETIINHLQTFLIEMGKGYAFFNTGDVLFAGTGELVEEIGKSIVYLGKEPSLAGGDIIILSHNQNPVFLNYALNSSYAKTQKSRGKAKLKVVHISASEIGSIYLMLPPTTEQHQIADYLDNKCSEIDNLIAIKQQKIEELKDYKKSIIYEYVTGKKECIF